MGYQRRVHGGSLGPVYTMQRFEEAVSVEEASLSMRRRLGASETDLLVAQGNLAVTYSSLGRFTEALHMRRDVYAGTLKLEGPETENTLLEANNYAVSLVRLQRFKEAKALLRKITPVARRILGESQDLTLRMSLNY